MVVGKGFGVAVGFAVAVGLGVVTDVFPCVAVGLAVKDTTGVPVAFAVNVGVNEPVGAIDDVPGAKLTEGNQGLKTSTVGRGARGVEVKTGNRFGSKETWGMPGLLVWVCVGACVKLSPLVAVDSAVPPLTITSCVFSGHAVAEETSTPS